MLTPAGKECRYFYGDYYRGRSHEECRLLNAAGLHWSPHLCAKCPLPDILLANACEHMQFTPRLERPYLILSPQIKVTAYCTKSKRPVDEPRIGCGQCHPLPEIFILDPNDTDAAS